MESNQFNIGFGVLLAAVLILFCTLPMPLELSAHKRGSVKEQASPLTAEEIAYVERNLIQMYAGSAMAVTVTNDEYVVSPDTPVLLNETRQAKPE